MDTRQKIDFIAEFMVDYVNKARASGLAVGLSGGIDSSVAAAIMKIAFPNDSLGLILPIKSLEKDEIYARKLADKINLDTITLDLSELQDGVLSETKALLNPPKERLRLSDANFRARLRMSSIYLAAGMYNYLVVGTDNRAELYTGYFTKYGDGGCDIMPLSNLLKREVYEIARYLDLPREIIERAPSAGLWEGQTDEGEMGVTYDEIDDYLSGKMISQKSIDIIESLHRRTEHKRHTPVACPEFR